MPRIKCGILSTSYLPLLSAVTLCISILLLSGQFASAADADAFSIIEVRRNIQMSENEPVARDYYINAGSQQGLKNNMVLFVYRRVPVRDPSGGQTLGDLQVPVGQVKVLFLQERLAVAREFQLHDYDSTPVLDQKGVMIGDKVQLAGAFIDKKKPVVKRATASEDLPHAKEKVEEKKGLNQVGSFTENSGDNKNTSHSESKVEQTTTDAPYQKEKQSAGKESEAPLIVNSVKS